MNFTEEELSKLTPIEDCVVRMLHGIPYKGERTLQFVGDAFGLSRERVRQLEESVLRIILKSNRISAMRSILHDYLEDHSGCRFVGCKFQRKKDKDELK